MFRKTKYSLWTLPALGAIVLASTAGARADGLTDPDMANVQTCMMEALRATPGFVDAQAQSMGGSDRALLLTYALKASSGRVFHRQVEVYQDGPRDFSIYMTEGLTPALFSAWQSCGIRSVQPPSP